VPYTQPSASVAGLRTMHQPWSPSLRGWLLLGQATGSKQASDQAGTVPGMKGTTKASRLCETKTLACVMAVQSHTTLHW
jgi:hypothetical protein